MSRRTRFLATLFLRLNRSIQIYTCLTFNKRFRFLIRIENIPNTSFTLPSFAYSFFIRCRFPMGAKSFPLMILCIFLLHIQRHHPATSFISPSMISNITRKLLIMFVEKILLTHKRRME